MNKIEQQISRFKKLDINELFKQSVIETKESLLGHVKTQNLFGVASDGGILGEYKWESYANLKSEHIASYHAPYGLYNLELEGDFHDDMVVSFNLYGDIEIDSTDNKTLKLELLVSKERGQDGGQLIFALTNENLIIYTKQLYPVLIKKIRNALGY